MDNDLKQARTEQFAGLLKYLNEIMGRLSSPSEEEINRISEQLKQLMPGEIPPFSGPPVAFYALSSALYRDGNLTMGELSQALSVPMSTATRMVDWWVDNGFALRLPDPDDRRVVRVALTDVGKMLHETIERTVSQSVRKCLACLTDEEQDILLTLVRKVAQGLRA